MAGIVGLTELQHTNGNSMLTVATTGDGNVKSEGGATTTSLRQGLAKQWCHTSGVGTPALADSFNTASVTDLETGGESFSFTNTMATANFSTQAFLHLGGSIGTVQQVLDSGAFQTTALTAAKSHTTSAAVDADKNITVHGDLA